MSSSGTAPQLAAGEVHAWRFSIGAHGPEPRALHADDRQRSERFVFDRDRARFLRARHVLRHLLGAYLGLDPRSLSILYSPHGKPGLDARHNLGFNMSHSGDHGLIAIARAHRVGVDIEELSARESLRELAATVCSGPELEELHDLPEDQLRVPFLRCWTRKEACLKALGVGLTVEPRGVTVGIRPLRSHARVDAAGRTEEVEVASLFEDATCVGALAVAGGYTHSQLFEWPA